MKDIRSIAVDVLDRARKEKMFVDDALDRARGGGLSPRDRGLLTSIVLGATRHRLTLDYIAQEISGAKEIEEPLRPILEVALFQLLFMDRVPDYAAVDAAVRCAPERARRFVNAVLRKVQRELEEFASPADDPRRILPRPDAEPRAFKSDIFPDDPVERLAVVHSHPLWLVERWVKRMGPEATRDILVADNAIPPLTARARVDRQELIAKLRAEGVSARPGRRPDSVILERPGKISSLAAFRDNLFQVQDETQMAVAPLLAGAKRVIDLCAAPGGKSIHLADLGCEVVACDVSPERVRYIDAKLNRVVADGTRPPFGRVFDGVLVDAPCSNTGVLARRADARWRLKPKDVTAMTRIQRALLAAARELVVPGGRIVYSTCSIEPEENDAIAGAGETILPSASAAGGFAAVINT